MTRRPTLPALVAPPPPAVPKRLLPGEFIISIPRQAVIAAKKGIQTSG